MVLTHFKRRHLILELLTLVALISFALFLAFQWQTIIEPLPTHFGFDGQPDAWGDKSSLLVSLVIVVVIYILLLVVEFFPRIWNFPVAVNEQNRENLTTMALDMFVLLKLVIVVAFCLLYTSWMFPIRMPTSISSYYTSLGRYNGFTRKKNYRRDHWRYYCI